MKLKKQSYGRDHTREEESGAIFNKTSTGIIFLLNIFLGIFLTPALITTSMLLKDTAMILANILLSAGYTTYFGSRILKSEISAFELILSCVGIAACIGLMMYLSPLIAPAGIIGALYYTNLVATAINGFFLLKNIVLPPLKRICVFILNKIGFNINADLFYRAPLSLSKTKGAIKDEYSIDSLLQDYYQTSLNTESDIEGKLTPFNNLIKCLSDYINKYTDSLFGSITRASEINALTGYIDEVSNKGRAVNALIFLNIKLKRKKTKIARLEKIKADVENIENRTTQNKTLSKDDKKTLSHYFDSFHFKMTEHTTFFSKAKKIIDDKIEKQKQKQTHLESCFPKNQ